MLRHNTDKNDNVPSPQVSSGGEEDMKEIQSVSRENNLCWSNIYFANIERKQHKALREKKFVSNDFPPPSAWLTRSAVISV